jgi:prophage regulatory protein
MVVHVRRNLGWPPMARLSRALPWFIGARRSIIVLDLFRPRRTKMGSLPEHRFLRLSQIIGDRKATPPIVPLIPISRSAWWEGVRTGRYPPSIKLGPGTTVWRADDIRKLLERPPAEAVIGKELSGCAQDAGRDLPRKRPRSNRSRSFPRCRNDKAG